MTHAAPPNPIRLVGFLILTFPNWNMATWCRSASELMIVVLQVYVHGSTAKSCHVYLIAYFAGKAAEEDTVSVVVP